MNLFEYEFFSSWRILMVLYHEETSLSVIAYCGIYGLCLYFTLFCFGIY